MKRAVRFVAVQFGVALVPLSLLVPLDAAWAACDPAAASGVNAVCSGTTVNQNDPFGYGTGNETGASVTVLSGASVTGTNFGIFLNNGSVVTNLGSISGGFGGLIIEGTGTTGTVFNAGSITASQANAEGIGINGRGSVFNSGSIITSGSNSTGIFMRSGTVTNAGSISGQLAGIEIIGDGAITNSGSIAGVQFDSIGVFINGSGIVTNSGSISGVSEGIQINGDGTVVNSGSITSGNLGVDVGGVGTLINSGTIAAATEGVKFDQRGTVINSGTIVSATQGINIFGAGAVINSGRIAAFGPDGIGIVLFANSTVINSGIISGGSEAMEFGANGALTLLPGSTIIGAIDFFGAGGTVNFRGGNHNLTFNTPAFAPPIAGVTVTGTTPFAVSGNQAAAIDPTPFALSWRTLSDFTSAVWEAVPQFGGGGAAGTGGAPLAFAPPDASSRIDNAFASLPGLSAYAGDTIAFKAPTVVQADGSAVWGRGFAGQRTQPADGVLLPATNQLYGGMIGGDFQLRPDLRVGGFVGGGHTRTSIDFGSQSDSDLAFAGISARYLFGASFLQAGLQGGFSQNASSRRINNNLAAGGIETARASFNGWYLSPEAIIGTHFALGRLEDATYTLTPSLKVRYLYGSYDAYTETGTTAPLTVGGQTVSTFEERGEAKLTRTVNFTPRDALALSAFGGVQGVQRVGGDTINATLLGQAIPFATPGKANVWGGYGGAGFEWRTGAVSIFSAGEYLALSDGSHVLSGRGGLRVGF